MFYSHLSDFSLVFKEGSVTGVNFQYLTMNIKWLKFGKGFSGRTFI